MNGEVKNTQKDGEITSDDEEGQGRRLVPRWVKGNRRELNFR